MLTEKELLEELKISQTTLWRLKKKGLPSIRVSSNYRYDKAVIFDWIKDNQASVDYKDIAETPLTVAEPQLPYLFQDEVVNNLKTPITYKYTITIPSLLMHNEEYLHKILTKFEIDELTNVLALYSDKIINEQAVILFCNTYLDIIKRRYQSECLDYDEGLHKFINQNNHPKIIWGNCLHALKKMKSESIHLMVTSPPYYNAGEYSKWDNLSEDLNDMRQIIRESYRVLNNHRV